MLKEIIEESPFYELAVQYGEGIGKGKLKALCDACLALTKAKAPRLVPILEGRLRDITDVSDLAQLEELVVDLGLAKDDEAVLSAMAPQAHVRQEEVRNACLTLTKVKAPWLMSIFEGASAISPTSRDSKSFSLTWVLPKAAKPLGL